MAGRDGHRSFGHIRKLPSRRWQASYVAPDMQRHAAPITFESRIDAEGWLAAERRLIENDRWTPPKTRQTARSGPPVLSTYADTWLRQRELKPRTRTHYRKLLDRHVLPGLGDVRVDRLTPALVRDWYSTLDPSTPTARSHAYALLRGILATATDDDLLPSNPCRIRGAGSVQRASATQPASVAELTTIVDTMPEDYRLMILLAGWCGLRLGELTELRRSDVDLKAGVVRVRRGVVWMKSGPLVGTPKTKSSVRDVTLPPHLIDAVKHHLQITPMAGRDALLFPSRTDPTKHLRPASLTRMFYPAREAAGRPDLRFHDLRHSAAFLATAAGGSLADVMQRLGHTTIDAALRYQHSTAQRQTDLAAALSDIAGK